MFLSLFFWETFMNDLQTDLLNVILLLGDILDRTDLTDDQSFQIESAKITLEEIEETL